ncbi:4-amino-4-deoxychorismate lyase [Persephonella hydrogeniphila]|uniref:4-amino-4-deoxychorismate lyase n=1 Tax=Persephonella hydrogeniphila TaxID=198703 RepID=A0A285N248_9AQUI|nr:aminotransferase class IV [Persephonella hydrogeniphila]SNZ03510.1 4-amino-4-deoxychorismate lyase [Persephonella hydrogeniphila]
MNEIITVNGELFDDRRCLRTLMYGEGVFETFRYNNGYPSKIKNHYRRMVEGAKLLGLKEISEEDFLYYVDKTVEKSEEKDLYIKVILLSEGNTEYPLLPYKTNVMVIAKPYRPFPKERISLTVAPFRVHSSNPLLRIKTTNFAEKVIAKRYAKEKGYDDAVFLNENGEITETTSANIFWIKGKIMYTPSVDCGLLPGITREAVIFEARKQGFTVVEGRFYLEDIKDADLIFVTNALNGIIRVGKFDLFAQEED